MSFEQKINGALGVHKEFLYELLKPLEKEGLEVDLNYHNPYAVAVANVRIPGTEIVTIMLMPDMEISVTSWRKRLQINLAEPDSIEKILEFIRAEKVVSPLLL